MSILSADKPRTIRLHGLRAIDETAVRLFLKLAPHQTQQVWEQTHLDKADLLLMSPDVADAAEQLVQCGGQVVWVVSRDRQAPQDGRQVLTRPLQLESFYDLLRSVGGVTPTVHVTAEPAPQVRAQSVAAKPATATATVAATAVAAERVAVETSSPVQGQSGQMRYRLQRWPSRQVLQEGREDTRLASFLSARFLTVSELEQLSHVARAQCERFVLRMQRYGLVEQRAGDTHAEPVVTPAPQIVMRSWPATDAMNLESPAVPVRRRERPSAAEAALPGLIGRLRERLGMRRAEALAR